MALKPPFQIAGDRQHGQEAQHAIDQRDIEIDEAAGDMRVERDQRDRHDGQHVDRGDAVDDRPAEDQTQHAEHDAEEDQDRGDDAGWLQPKVFSRCSSNGPAIGAGRLVRIGGFDIEPVDEQACRPRCRSRASRASARSSWQAPAGRPASSSWS